MAICCALKGRVTGHELDVVARHVQAHDHGHVTAFLGDL